MKTIKGYEGLYSITEDGRVWSHRKAQFKNPQDNGHGYKYVQLKVNGYCKNFYIHRLVAEAFIPNPENKKEVDHIDNNTENNVVTNLRWATPKENQGYRTLESKKNSAEKIRKALSRPVLCVELNQVFSSIRAAARALNLNSISGIRSCVNKDGKYKTTAGYHWEYAEVV